MACYWTTVRRGGALCKLNMSPAVEYLGLQWLVIGLPCAGVVLYVN